MMAAGLGKWHYSGFLLRAFSVPCADCGRSVDHSSASIVFGLLLLSLTSSQHLSYDLIVLVEQKWPRKLFLLFSLQGLSYLLVLLDLEFLICEYSIYLGLITSTLGISHRLRMMRWLPLVVLMQLQELSWVVLLGVWVPGWRRLTLDTCSFNWGGFDLAKILSVSSEVCHTIACR